MKTPPPSHRTATADGLGQEPLPELGTLPEAILYCCALAAYGNPLSGGDAQFAYVNRVLARALHDHTPAELARWRSMDTIYPRSWDYRWQWARRAVQLFYPDAEGANDIPMSHDNAGLPGSYPPHN